MMVLSPTNRAFSPKYDPPTGNTVDVVVVVVDAVVVAVGVLLMMMICNIS